MSPTILGFGEWLGDIEIVKPIKVTRSAVLYEATHHKEKVLLKVAHPGEPHKIRLQREALFLADRMAAGDLPEELPHLRPAYVGTTVAEHPYGKTMLGGHLLYFYLIEFFEGEPLSDILKEKPLPWLNHVGWITISLSTAINYLNVMRHLHLGVNPDVILVRFDDKPWVPRILLFDLGLISPLNDVPKYWYPDFVHPAYLAPELSRQTGLTASYRSDVYSTGLVLYEMLIGEPAFPHDLHGDARVRSAVVTLPRADMYRRQETEEVARIASQATDVEPMIRHETVAAVGNALIEQFGHVPDPEPSRWPSKNTIIVIIFALLAIALIVAVAILA
ncbi:MAG: protein kinase [Anaerolineales bacterium]|nr:protein kinase [Anaerolineales bacterium]MCB9126852.1 protein kinase [Ardenticatenales bacterium]